MPRAEIDTTMTTHRPKDRKLEKILPFLRPVDNLLFVDQFEYTGKIGSGLLELPEQAKIPPPVGRVFAIGPGILKTRCSGCAKTGHFRVPTPDIEVGDYILWGMYDGKPFQIEHEGELYEFVILPDDIVLGKLDYA